MPKSYKLYYKGAGMQMKQESKTLVKQVKKVKKDVVALKAIAKDQVHFVNKTTAIYSITNVADAAVQIYGLIRRGDGSGDRTGDTIRPIRLRFGCRLELTPAAVTDPVRILIVQTKAYFGAVPAIGSVLNSATTATFPTSDYNDLNVQYKADSASNSNILILYDKLVELTAVAKPVAHITKVFNLRKRRPVSYSSDVGNDTDTLSGTYWIFILSSKNNTSVQWNAHLHFDP